MTIPEDELDLQSTRGGLWRTGDMVHEKDMTRNMA